MDTISTAGTLAWAMEAGEKGLWQNGLRFGETEGLSQVFDDIAHRRGIGAELAEGSKRLSEKYGGKDFAIQTLPFSPRAWNWPPMSRAVPWDRDSAMPSRTGAAAT